MTFKADMRIFIKIDREVESRERVALLQHTFRERDRWKERGIPMKWLCVNQMMPLIMIIINWLMTDTIKEKVVWVITPSWCTDVVRKFTNIKWFICNIFFLEKNMGSDKQLPYFYFRSILLLRKLLGH